MNHLVKRLIGRCWQIITKHSLHITNRNNAFPPSLRAFIPLYLIQIIFYIIIILNGNTVDRLYGLFRHRGLNFNLKIYFYTIYLFGSKRLDFRVLNHSSKLRFFNSKIQQILSVSYPVCIVTNNRERIYHYFACFLMFIICVGLIYIPTIKFTKNFSPYYF